MCDYTYMPAGSCNVMYSLHMNTVRTCRELTPGEA